VRKKWSTTNRSATTKFSGFSQSTIKVSSGKLFRGYSLYVKMEMKINDFSSLHKTHRHKQAASKQPIFFIHSSAHTVKSSLERTHRTSHRSERENDEIWEIPFLIHTSISFTDFTI
jgi:hypothetical protein